MKAVLVVCAAAALSACGAIEPVRTELSESGMQAPAHWQVRGATDAEVSADWLADLGDARLNELVVESLTNNFELRAAAARVKAARARARIAGAAELPALDIGSAASRRGSANNGRRSTNSTIESTLSARWDVDLWGRLADSTRAAILEAIGSEADLAGARRLVAARVARAWFDLAEAGAQVALADETVRNFSDNLKVVDDGFRSGLNNALDVRLERANIANAQSRLQLLRLQRYDAARDLEVLVGRYPAGLIDASDNLPRLRAPVPAGLPVELLNRRADLRAASARLAVTDAQLASALKNRLPEFTLTASGGLSSAALAGLLDFKSLLFTIAGRLAAPLLRGGELDAQRDLARAQNAEALVVYAQAVLVAFREVESALRAEALLADQESALESAVLEARAAQQLALERYRSGLTDIITWLEARRRAFDASSTLLSVNNQRVQNRVNLHLALGGTFSLESAVHTLEKQVR